MGFRNPFRIQVDDNDVAYVTDYSPDSNARRTSAGRRAPAASRSCASRPTTAGRCATRPNLPYYRWNFNTIKPLDADARRRTSAATRTGARTTTSRWNTGGPHEPGCVSPPITQPDLWYSFRDNANPPLGTPCLGVLRRVRRHLPAALPRALHTGVAPHGAAPYRYDADNPSTTKFPPYYDGVVHPRRVQRDTLREVRVDATTRSSRSTARSTAARRCRHLDRSRSSATTRWTCSSGPTATSTC